MKNQLQKLEEIHIKAMTLAYRIDVNCEESEKQFRELNSLANELGQVINEINSA